MMVAQFLSSFTILVTLLALHRAIAFSNIQTGPSDTFDQFEIDHSFDTISKSKEIFSRRDAIKRVTGMALGLPAVLASKPAYAAAKIYEIRMGTEENPEELAFEPDSIKIRRGDSIRWTNNPGMTRHNVVFRQEDVPKGVDAELLSMNPSEKLSKSNASFERQFDKKGEYTYKCIFHCSVMIGHITVV
eukprot:CAMPEP_0194156416 /NCGR_PEP_ID=MMETSP0152-20130528/68271_1 /TAXON_ID=1049557 /ORGANISM="Thalassiothrix antarctica, Strain L6-D1" /LENGTH=187 /DNA_ID=CAMNT_0038864073 /DNA_START=245 /DNA_END=808 /DNA_ORIENTATION=-